MRTPPCRGCEVRQIGCHRDCEVYRDFANEKKAERKALKKEVDALDARWNYGRKR